MAESTRVRPRAETPIETAPPGPGRANSRSALIAAALGEFTEKGYESATVNGIAERAGVTTGALYAHFHGKLDLLLETIGLRPMGEFLRDIHQSVSGRSKSDLVVSIGRDMARPQPPEASLLLDVIVLARRDTSLAGRVRRLLEAKLNELVVATDAGRRAGLISPDLGSQDLARILLVIAFGKMVLSAIDEQAPTAPLFTRLIDVLFWSETQAQSEANSALDRVTERAAQIQRAKLEFEAVVLQAVEAGHSLREVGLAAGVSHEQIRRIAGERRTT